jgi:ElaA protein
MQWIEWQWRRLEAFDAPALYEMLALRQRVFVVEQNCIYLDADGFDGDTEHLTGHDGDRLVCCLRLMPPGVHGREAAIGRVAVDRNYRRQGLAAEMVRNTLTRIEERHGTVRVRLAAQQYLVNFYASFGFEPVSEPYDEDGILHVDMLLDDER